MPLKCDVYYNNGSTVYSNTVCIATYTILPYRNCWNMVTLDLCYATIQTMQGFLISILAWNNWWKLSHVIVITDAILKPVKSNFSAHFGNNHSCIKNVITKAVFTNTRKWSTLMKVYSFKNTRFKCGCNMKTKTYAWTSYRDLRT